MVLYDVQTKLYVGDSEEDILSAQMDGASK
jgi:phosphoglycolate phosphatase-like HAD superfamily hydrolase